MAGHSKWAKIKRKKGANDAKRGALFTKLGKNITIAAASGGGDPEMNFTLRLAIEKAKQANMPVANIERAVKKGTGESGDGSTLQKVVYEGTGPEGSLFVVRCTTDNTNRTVAELRRLFDDAGANLGSAGTAMWQFEEVGLVLVELKLKKEAEKFGAKDEYVDVDLDTFEEDILEVDGVEDYVVDEDEGEKVIEVYTKKEDLMTVFKEIESKKYKIESSDIIFKATNELKVSKKIEEKVQSIMETIEDHDDVDDAFTNVAI